MLQHKHPSDAFHASEYHIAVMNIHQDLVMGVGKTG